MRSISPLLFLILVGFLPLIGGVEGAGAISTTDVSIIPEMQSVGVSEPFVVNVTAGDVVNLAGWQVLVFYDPMVLNFTGFSLPAGHVFEGKNFWPVQSDTLAWSKTLLNETNVDFQSPGDAVWRSLKEEPYDPPPPRRQYNIAGWLDEDRSGDLTVNDFLILDPNLPSHVEYYRVTALRQVGSRVVIKVEIAYATWGVVLLPPSPSFNGSGTLCQLHFSGLNAGNATLKLSSMDTYLLDPDVLEIPYEAHHGSVLVTGPDRLSSTVSIEANPTSVMPGSAVAPSGQILPAELGVDVLIWRHSSGATQFLDIVNTNSSGRFMTIWAAPGAGTHDFQASRLGDWQTRGADSPLTTVTVFGPLTFDIDVDGVNYSVSITSNSTISHFNFNQSLPGITFNTTGNPGTTGFCNVTVPKALLKGESWMITIDNEIWAFTPTENTSHSSLYFTYSYTSTRRVVIEGTWVIQEFPSPIILPLVMIAVLIMTLIYKKKAPQSFHH